MTRPRRLTVSMAWSLLGNALPLGAAILSIPLLMHGMGPDRFGLLTFVWMIVGYSSLLDLGIGRALTQGIAERMGRNALSEIPSISQAGLTLLLLVGIGGGAALAAMSGWVAGRFLKMPGELVLDAQRSIGMAATAVPVVVLGSAFRGVLEAYQRFRAIGVVRVIVGSLLFVSPLLVLRFSHDVWAVVGVLSVIRLLELAAYAVQSSRLVPGLFRKFSLSARLLGSLLSFGLWSSLNNLVGGLMSMAYVDRLNISAMLGTGALAFFATPFDMVAKILIVPTAVISVLFPEFSSLGREGSQQAHAIATRAIRLIVFGMAPIFLFLLATAEPLLVLWLGNDFATRCRTTLQLVSIGTMAVSVAYVPFVFIQAMGRPDLTAKRHFLEIPFYVAASAVAVRVIGLEGGALVWCMWAMIDLALVFRIKRALEKEPRAASIGGNWLQVPLFLGVAFAAGVSGFFWLQVTTGFVLPLLFLAWGWRRWLSSVERSVVVRWLPERLRLQVLGPGGGE